MTKAGISSAVTMLGAILKEGAKSYEEVKNFCRKGKITRGELRAARKELGVITTQSEDTWFWSLPKGVGSVSKSSKGAKEKDIEAYLRDQVKALGGKAYKFTSPGNSGVPDRLVSLPDYRVIFVELKAPGRKSTALQLKRQSELKEHGHTVLVIDTYEGVDDLIDQIILGE